MLYTGLHEDTDKTFAHFPYQMAWSVRWSIGRERSLIAVQVSSLTNTPVFPIRYPNSSQTKLTVLYWWYVHVMTPPPLNTHEHAQGGGGGGTASLRVGFLVTTVDSVISKIKNDNFIAHIATVSCMCHSYKFWGSFNVGHFNFG